MNYPEGLSLAAYFRSNNKKTGERQPLLCKSVVWLGSKKYINILEKIT
jgi:hypothetical protein